MDIQAIENNNFTLNEIMNDKKLKANEQTRYFQSRETYKNTVVVSFYFGLNQEKVYAVNINIKPLLDRIIVTFYLKDTCPIITRKLSAALKFKKDIKPNDELHTPDLHERVSPLSRHCHYELSGQSSQIIEEFLNGSCNLFSLKSDFIPNIVASLNYIHENPCEPGVFFTNNDYSFNGGAQAFNESSTKTAYIQGPLICLDNEA